MQTQGWTQPCPHELRAHIIRQLNTMWSLPGGSASRGACSGRPPRGQNSRTERIPRGSQSEQSPEGEAAVEEEGEGHSQQREQHARRTGSKREDVALRKGGLGAEPGNTGRTGTLGVGVSNGGVAGGGVERLEESESVGIIWWLDCTPRMPPRKHLLVLMQRLLVGWGLQAATDWWTEEGMGGRGAHQVWTVLPRSSLVSPRAHSTMVRATLFE